MNSIHLNTPKAMLELSFSVFIGDANQLLAACLKEGRLHKGSVDAVFYDMFSPQAVPELWCSDVFASYHAVLHPTHGQLLTYSCARAVKDALTEAGFTYTVTKQALGRKRGGLIAQPIRPLQ
ncbi:MAG: MnmC family methyltransferase [Vampirovibrionales bacterium]